ncbi:MAG: cation:H+ antiporter [Candidatus Paceibacteria bacterium]|jgi:cation:H+ antiporter
MEMIMVQSLVILAGALFVLVRGADVFVAGAKQVGASFGMSSFAIGVLIVGLGTSVPELASSLAAVLNGTTEIVIANVVGSNITNILLIGGVLALLGGPIMISTNLLKTELPLFAIATVHFIASVYDGVVDRIEALLLVGTLTAYIWYLLSTSKRTELDQDVEKRMSLQIKSLVFIALGLAAVLVGAHYTVESAVALATGFAVPIGLVSIAAIAIGTSLPELFVSIQAVRNNETDLAIGNIFGSNAFNILLVVGIPGLITPLITDEVVMQLGLGIMLAASVILFVTGLARQIQKWEGIMMLLFFVFFLVKLIAFV